MKNKKHSFEFKIKVVEEYLNEEGGYKYLGKKYNIHHSLLRTWVSQFNEYGYLGLTKSMSKTQYSSDFKLTVLHYRKENQLSYRETAIHFGIKNPSVIASWTQKLRVGGSAALEGKIGRPRKQMSKEEKNHKQIPNDQPLNETEREELERLREESRMKDLELIILKKLNALPTDPTDKKQR